MVLGQVGWSLVRLRVNVDARENSILGKIWNVGMEDVDSVFVPTA